MIKNKFVTKTIMRFNLQTALLAFLASTVHSHDDFRAYFDDEFSGENILDRNMLIENVAMRVPVTASHKELCEQNFSAFYDSKA